MAIRFDTSGEGLTRTSDLLNYNADFTVAMWVRLVTDTNTFAGVFCIFGSGTDEFDGLETGSNGTRLTVISERGGVFASASLADMTAGTWYYVALVRSGSTVSGYLITQAKSVTTANVTKATDSSTVASMRVGQWVDGSELFNGRVMGIKAWSVALTQTEILNEMDTLLPRRFTNLYGWWPCFPGGGERIRDYSGNGRDWTEGGTVSDEDPAPVGWGTMAEWVGQATGGGITQAVGLNAEADTAQALARLKSRAAGQASETDTAQALGRVKTKVLGLVSETESVFALTVIKTRALGLVSESEESFALGRVKIWAIGLVSETDIALALGMSKIVAVGLVSEGETAFGLMVRKTMGVGLVSESDEAFVLGRVKLREVGLVSEAESALALFMNVLAAVYTVALSANPSPSASPRSNKTPTGALDSNPSPSVSVLSG